MKRNLVVLCLGLVVVLTFVVARADQPAPKSTILVPDQAFPGGVLTGVVLGPDDQPVPNAPVEVAGGVPATLSGEVVGDQPQQQQRPPERAPGSPGKPPVECGMLLQQGVTTPSPGTPAGMADGGVRQLTTDAAGRFAICMAPNAPQVTVGTTDGTKSTVRAFTGPITLPSQPPSFFQPGQKVDFTGGVRDARAEQGGNTWNVPTVQAWSGDGSQTVSTLLVPRAAGPGPIQLSYTRPDGRRYRAQASVFRITQASLDRSRLRSNEGAAFEYTVQFAAQGGQQLCVRMHVGGPVMLAQAPPAIIAIDASGGGRFGGRVRATQVAPGSATPFEIAPIIAVCGGSETAQVVEIPGILAPGEKVGLNPQPLPPGSDVALNPQPLPPGTKAGLNPQPLPPRVQLLPGPVLVNPWAEHTEAAGGPPSMPSQTASSTAASRGTGKTNYGKVPTPLWCSPLSGPAITGVTDRYGHATDTFTQGNDYYIHGCNFGDPGDVHLVFPARGWEPAATHPLIWNGEYTGWNDDLLKMMLDAGFGGRVDQDGITLRVVRKDGAVAELHNQKFRAVRRNMIITWIPRTRLFLGTAHYQNQTFPASVTTQGDQNNSYYEWDSSEMPVRPPAVMIQRSGKNIGGVFTVGADEINLSRMPAGFTIVKVQPYLTGTNQCGEHTGPAVTAMHWKMPTVLKVDVNACFIFSPNVETGNADSEYGFTVLVSGPQGVSPWAATQ